MGCQSKIPSSLVNTQFYFIFYTLCFSPLTKVDIFTNQQINGGGQTAVTQLATLSVSAANAALLQGGGSILLRNVEANLDLTGVACSQIPYICTRLRRNPASQPEFTLQGIPSDSVFISCQGFQCSGESGLRFVTNNQSLVESKTSVIHDKGFRLLILPSKYLEKYSFKSKKWFSYMCKIF